MRALLILLSVLPLSACAASPQVIQARMPLEIRRAEGQAPRMGDVRLHARDDRTPSLAYMDVYFDSDGKELGGPNQVNWSMEFGAYCRDRTSWVHSVLIGPSGQVWRGFRVAVLAGPDRGRSWSSGSSAATGLGAVATPGLIEAMTAGGRFTLALEDDEGQLWNETVIDTLDRARRERLFAANWAAVSAADPNMPVSEGEMVMVVANDSPPIPYPPRPCPSPPA